MSSNGRARLVTRRIRVRIPVAGGLAVILAGIILSLSDPASAKEPLGRNWPPNQHVSMDRIDHSTYDALLNKYVDEVGYVNYAGWQRSPADRQALQQYLVHLSQASPSLQASREAQLAFWINAYNALTIEGILQVYPTDSIRNHTARLIGYNIWKDLPLLVGGREYSLDAIEHQVLRNMGEPRIHFALVCAAAGCPRLLNEAYVPDRLEQQLATNSVDFFSRRQNFVVDRNGTMHVSAILNWFKGDFGDSQVERFRYLQRYLPEHARQLAVHPRTRVNYLDYDWSLNDQARKGAEAGSARR